MDYREYILDELEELEELENDLNVDNYSLSYFENTLENPYQLKSFLDEHIDDYNNISLEEHLTMDYLPNFPIYYNHIFDKMKDCYWVADEVLEETGGHIHNNDFVGFCQYSIERAAYYDVSENIDEVERYIKQKMIRNYIDEHGADLESEQLADELIEGCKEALEADYDFMYEPASGFKDEITDYIEERINTFSEKEVEHECEEEYDL